MFRRKIQGRKRAAIRKLRIEECESLFFGVLVRERPTDAPFLDVNNDGIVAPLDALLVINSLGDSGSASGSVSVRTAISTWPGLDSAFEADDEEQRERNVGFFL